METDLMGLLMETKRVSKETLEAREDTRTDAIAAIRKLEAALQEALGGAKLRGLKNLGNSQVPLYAARVRGNPDTRITFPTPGHDAEALVLTPNGKLTFTVIYASQHGVVRIEETEALDGDLLAEDLESFTGLLAQILGRHVAASIAVGQKCARIRDLSEAILRTLTREEK